MNNDLKNFLEEERKGYMRNSNWEVSESELQDHDTRLINFVLELVEKEIEKKSRKSEEFGFCRHCPFHKGDMEHDFGKCAGYEEGLTDISTIINSLKV